MALESGTRLSHYEITDQIGKGGMGEVYRARDNKLGREVAIKVLPQEFAQDAERLARLEREARMLAALNHPNIAAIHGLEEADETRFLVLELVEGETLADRLRGGAIPVEESLKLALQVAEALEAAHEKGVVHRDLKPANIKVTPNGRVKVLDFGLAKAFIDEQADLNLSNSPTLSMAATQQGVILGTAAYMSPEQAEARTVDRRSDIWAFGCVLFEMLSGRPAFSGKTLLEIVSSVMKSDPDWSLLPENTPTEIRSLLKRCLQKDPHRRMRDSGDVSLLVEDALKGPAEARPVPHPARMRRDWVWAGALVAVLAGWVVTGFDVRPRTASPEMRFEIVAAGGMDFALSPDGLWLVYPAQGQLWLWSRQSGTEQPLEGTEGGGQPFWSPDNRFIGFFSGGQLKKIQLETRFVTRVTDLPVFGARGATWNPNGVILFGATSDMSPLFQVKDDVGGTAVPVTDASFRMQAYPQFLSDPQRFIFFARTSDGQGIYLGSLDSAETEFLFESDGEAVFAPPNHVLFPSQGALLAQRLDSDTMRPLGEPETVAPEVVVTMGVGNTSVNAQLAASASATGTIAYRASRETVARVWRNRNGDEISVTGAPEEGVLSNFRLSPDGETLAFNRWSVRGTPEIWLEPEAGIASVFSAESVWQGNAVWSRSGRNIVFSSLRTGILDLYQKDVGRGETTPLLITDVGKVANDWSPNDEYLLYQTVGPDTADDLWVLPMSGDDLTPFPVANGPALECCARFSPDGRWIVYRSWETGRSELYVQKFPPDNRGSRRITSGGSGIWAWGPEGRELFYTSGGEMRVLSIVNDQETFTVESDEVVPGMPPGVFFDTADGQRFVTTKLIADSSPVKVILNSSILLEE